MYQLEGLGYFLAAQRFSLDALRRNFTVHTSPNFKSNAERDEKQKPEETQKPDEQEEGGAEQQEV